eukprot:Polyplicarium_translucidae@DN4525_c0_g1_i1.p1
MRYLLWTFFSFAAICRAEADEPADVSAEDAPAAEEPGSAPAEFPGAGNNPLRQELGGLLRELGQLASGDLEGFKANPLSMQVINESKKSIGELMASLPDVEKEPPAVEASEDFDRIDLSPCMKLESQEACEDGAGEETCFWYPSLEICFTNCKTISNTDECASHPECRTTQIGPSTEGCSNECFKNAPDDFHCVWCQAKTACNLMTQIRHRAAEAAGGNTTFPMCEYHRFRKHAAGTSPFSGDPQHARLRKPPEKKARVKTTWECVDVSQGLNLPAGAATSAMQLKLREQQQQDEIRDWQGPICELPPQKHGEYRPPRNFLKAGESVHLLCDPDFVLAGARNDFACGANGHLEAHGECVPTEFASPATKRLSEELQRPEGEKGVKQPAHPFSTAAPFFGKKKKNVA